MRAEPPMTIRRLVVLPGIFALTAAVAAIAQSAPPPSQAAAPAQQPPAGPPAPPPWAAQIAVEQKVNARFDADNNGWLSLAERKSARETLAREAAERPPLGLPVPPTTGIEPTKPGARMTPAGVRTYRDAPAFDPDVVRTFFLDFEEPDWEQTLEAFRFTDIDVPARLTVDGQVFNDVGIHFRGASSFLFVAPGRKRSLNVNLDFVNKNQRLGGYRTFNLLNSNGDPTMLKALLYYHVARQYMPAPKANYVKVVINGEYWGVYVNTQQEDRDFINDWWKTTGGTRWKAPGSPWGRAGLQYVSENVDDYRKLYEIKSKDDPKAWAALITLTRVLTQTPLDRLEAALTPIFDIDHALKFLALESTFINDDGYWVRASDYNLYLDTSGKFHVYPHDGNEAFFDPPPAVRGGAAKGTELDPFIGSNDPNKVLISRLLAVPSLRTRYLRYVKDMATNWLDWQKLGPLAAKFHALVDTDVQMDTRKLDSYEAFKLMVESNREIIGARGPVVRIGLKNFADQRRQFLLNYPAIRELK
jgi:hypothetical protein